MTAAARLMLTYLSATALTTCTATNTTAIKDKLRCSPVTANLGSPGSRPCRLTMIPNSTTADSSINEVIPVARLAYHNAVLAVIPLITCRPTGRRPTPTGRAAEPSRPAHPVVVS